MNARIQAITPVDLALQMYGATKLTVPTEADYAKARESIRAEIMRGEEVAGFTFGALLDCEFNSDGYTGTVNDLHALFTSAYKVGTTATWLGAVDLAEKIIDRQMPEDAIEDRAHRYAREREAAHG